MADKNMEAQISVEFEEATSRQSLNSGETINTLWGKVKRWLTDLKSVAFSGSYNDLSNTPTTATTETDGLMSAEDKTKLDSADDTYALKSKYGDTMINVGRQAGSVVGEYSTAEGYDVIASGHSSHAEGAGTIASDGNCHAEGVTTKASGRGSHSEGWYTTASGYRSHAEGYGAIARGHSSHAEGHYTIATKEAEHASGQYNQSNSDTLFSVGDGTADDARHNAFEITTDGGKLHDEEIMTQNKVSNPNLLINPDFGINQRGLTTYSGISAYSVDHWFRNSEATMNIAENGITLTYSGTSNPSVFQRIENTNRLSGKTLTFSACINGSVYSCSNTLPSSVPSSISYWAYSRLDGEISTPNNSIPHIRMQIHSGMLLCVLNNVSGCEWAKLEIGSTATPYSPPDPATELIKCQRYYQIRSTNNIAAVDMRPNMREGADIKITALSDGNYSYSAEW